MIFVDVILLIDFLRFRKISVPNSIYQQLLLKFLGGANFDGGWCGDLLVLSRIGGKFHPYRSQITY
jgi:hypothetical protein